MSHVALISTTTSDGVKLHGALHRPMTCEPTGEVALLLHGTGSNFYSPTLWLGLIPNLNELGVTVAAVNTRGHDWVTPAFSLGQRRLLGAAYEQIDDCRLDITAWLQWLAQQQYARVTLIGHSMGGLKAIYSQAVEPQPSVERLIALSAPRLATSQFQSSAAWDRFQVELAEAESLIEAGQPETLLETSVPLPLLITARGYVDKYGREDRYDLLRFVPRLSIPQLYLYGEREMNGVAFRQLPDQLEQLSDANSHLRAIGLVTGADHVYTGCHTELAARVIRWWKRTRA